MGKVARTIEEVMDLKKELATTYGQLWKDFDDDEKYYDLQFLDALGLPDEFTLDGTVLPTAREIVDTAVDHVAPAFRRVSVPRVSASPTATKQATALADFYRALLSYFERAAKDNPFRQVVKHLFMHGMGCMKEQYDPARIPMEPIQEDDEDDENFKLREQDFKDAKSSLVPFALEVVHPREIMPDPWNDPPEFYIQTSRVKVAAALHYERFERGMLKLTDSVDIIEYWDSESRALMVDTTPMVQDTSRKNVQPILAGDVDEEDFHTHGLGGMPYTVYASGLGNDNSNHKPELKYVGLLRFLKSMLQAESRGYSITDIVLKGQAFPNRVAQGDNTDQMEDFKFEFGVVKKLPPGVTLVDIQPLAPADSLRAHVADTTARIERNSAPRSVRGVQDPGISTGFQQQLVQNKAALKYGTVAEAFQKMLEDLCKIAARNIERKVKGPVTLIKEAEEDEFVSISKRTINGHHAVDVKINVSEAEDELRKNQNAAQLVAANIWTRRHAIKKISPDVDPNRMFAGIMAENTILSPIFMQFLSQLAVQNVSEELSFEQLIEQVENAVTAGGAGFSGPTPNLGSERSGSDAQGDRSDQANQRTLAGRNQGV